MELPSLLVPHLQVEKQIGRDALDSISPKNAPGSRVPDGEVACGTQCGLMVSDCCQCIGGRGVTVTKPAIGVFERIGKNEAGSVATGPSPLQDRRHNLCGKGIG